MLGTPDKPPFDLILAKHLANNEFSKWRRTKIAEMEGLALRVFALGKRGYMGCGFHWAMLRNLGSCIARLNDFDNGEIYHGENAWIDQMILQINVEELEKSIIEAEGSAKEFQRVKTGSTLDGVESAASTEGVQDENKTE